MAVYLRGDHFKMDTDQFLVPRACLLEPHVSIEAAAVELSAAVDAHMRGDAPLCEQLLKQADRPEIQSWLESVWGSKSTHIHRLRTVPDAPPRITGKEPQPHAMLKRAVVERDGYGCRFCGMPVIPKAVRSLLNSLYPQAARWGTRNNQQHAALQCMWLQLDHVLPLARGGKNSLHNLVVTCAGCNFGRMSYTLAEMGLLDPRDRPPTPGKHWDGLTRIL